MRVIYHLVIPHEWQQAPPGPYRAASLATEGFIHCSNADQVEWAANKFHAHAIDLVALCIDAAALGDTLKDEDPGLGQTFPHIYGPVERHAIRQVEPLQRDTAGRWTFRPPVS